MCRRGNADLVPIGKVSKPHGIKGEIKIYPYSGSVETLTSYCRFFLSFSDNEGLWYEVEKSRSQGRVAVVALVGVYSRNDSESLVGYEVCVDIQEMPDIAQDEFYWNDIIGMSVTSADGKTLGKVKELMATGAHDIIVVRGEDGREYMIPVVGSFIREVDKERRTIVVDLPDGLLEINK